MQFPCKPVADKVVHRCDRSIQIPSASLHPPPEDTSPPSSPSHVFRPPFFFKSLSFTHSPFLSDLQPFIPFSSVWRPVLSIHPLSAGSEPTPWQDCHLWSWLHFLVAIIFPSARRWSSPYPPGVSSNSSNRLCNKARLPSTAHWEFTSVSLSCPPAKQRRSNIAIYRGLQTQAWDRFHIFLPFIDHRGQMELILRLKATVFVYFFPKEDEAKTGGLVKTAWSC